jgi:hypothetical protein
LWYDGGMGAWLTQNWFNLLSAVGVIGSLLFTAVSVRSETKVRRVGNLLTLTQSHRELWRELFHNPKLARVLEASPNLRRKPVTRDETIFANLVILHLSSAFVAIQTGLTIKPEGLRLDVGEFFSLPIPRAIWEKTKVLQNDDFVEFVDQCVGRKGADSSPFEERRSRE